MITEQQYQRLMNEYQSSGVVDHAAMKAGMDRKTARRYLRTGLRPAELRKPHTWRTREDPLAAITLRVSSYSTARVRDCAYSVPSRLIGAFVQAHVSEETVRFVYRGEEAASYPRSIGRAPRIDCRHVIASLVRKPGAFARYLYREEMFPRPVFRQAYDRLSAVEEGKAGARYLRLLQLAAEFGEDRVADGLGAALRAGELPLADVMELRLREPAPAQPATIAVFTPELAAYDALLTEVAS
jgi:hypothetical protein